MAKQAGKIAAIITSGGFKECVSAAIDFIPVVGNIKSGIEFITGKDPITGRKLEPWERAVSAVGIVGGPAAKAVKHGGKLAVKGGKVLQQQGSKLVQQGGKLLEKGGNLLGKAADLLDSSRTQLAGAGAGYKNFSVSTGISAGKSNNSIIQKFQGVFDHFSATRKQKANFGEITANGNYLNNPIIKNAGYDLEVIGKMPPTSLDDKIVQGIDLIYVNKNPNSPIKYVISEVKYEQGKLGYTKDGK